MTSSKDYFSTERIIAVFFLFVLANSSLLIHYFSPLQDTGWQDILSKSLLYFGAFGQAAVIGIMCFFYLIRAKTWLSKDNKRIVVTLGLVLGLGFSTFDSLSESSILVFFRDVFMVGLIILGLPLVVDKVTSKSK